MLHHQAGGGTHHLRLVEGWLTSKLLVLPLVAAYFRNCGHVAALAAFERPGVPCFAVLILALPHGTRRWQPIPALPGREKFSHSICCGALADEFGGCHVGCGAYGLRIEPWRS
ncbi:hypothetical protein PIB30_038723 [Stylosanthes scabra]|uniref:Uncharacterized protein n=1 Tax=Stylosanthes scabra TaxID=79078 RepID=A0ABU6SF39_9FABA|nr:hypothetical protein [Stylosanthes scabra]